MMVSMMRCGEAVRGGQWRRWLAAGVLLLLSAGTALARDAAAEAGVASETGLLWQIEQPGSGKTSYLFGTIHSEDERVIALPPAVKTALAQSREFVMEMVPDPESMLAASESMQLAPGQSLRVLAGKQLFEQTARALSQRGVPAEATDRMKPWAAMVMLSMPQPRTGLVLDVLLYSEAVQAGKETSGLETAQEQLDVFDKLSMADQLALLQETVAQLPQLDSMMEKIHSAYLARNLAELARLNDQYAGADARLAQKINVSLIDQRNQRMVQRMQRSLQQGGAFIAVGALHLPGRQGLLNLLRQRGYRVQAVY